MNGAGGKGPSDSNAVVRFPSLYVAFAQANFFYITPYQVFKNHEIIASLLPMLLGFLGIWRIVVRFLSPLSALPLVGLGLYEQGFPLLAQCVEIGLPELLILVFLSHFIPHMWSFKRPIFDRYAVLLSVGIVWLYAALLTVAGAYRNRPLQTQLSCRVEIVPDLSDHHPGLAFHIQFNGVNPEYMLVKLLSC